MSLLRKSDLPPANQNAESAFVTPDFGAEKTSLLDFGENE
jgi:hypothetical protein